MGWGAGNPEPVAGPLRLRRDSTAGSTSSARTGGTPVLTLCCAPDWMKGGKPGADNTDWSQAALETAPDPAHYEDFAALAATVAKRYPDVRHFIVWNEFKGFWNDARGPLGLRGLHPALQPGLQGAEEGRPGHHGRRALSGDGQLRPAPERQTPRRRCKGPWGAMDQRILDAFDYWNKHKAGADFVVVDGSSYTKDDDLLPDAFAATDKFTAVSRWLRERDRRLPLWWAEYYVEPADGDDDRDGWTEPHRVAVQAAGMIAMAARRHHRPPSTGTRRTRRAPTAPAACGRRPTRAGGAQALPMLDLSPASTRRSRRARGTRRSPSPRTTAQRTGSCRRQDRAGCQHPGPDDRGEGRRGGVRHGGVRGEVAHP